MTKLKLLNSIMHVTVQQKAASCKYLYAVFYIFMVIKNSLPVVSFCRVKLVITPIHTIDKLV